MKKITCFKLISSTVVLSFCLSKALLADTAKAGSEASSDNLNSYSYISPFGPYELNYLLPYSLNSSKMSYDDIKPNAENLNYEVKFQISAQSELIKNLFHKPVSLNMFYTQVSYWQFYSQSAYFRETNYNPGFFFHFKPTITHLPLKMYSIDLGGMHQSNGLGSTNERSWNRVFLNITFHLNNDWTLSLRPWYRVHVLENEDYNPNITDYLGNGDLRLSYSHSDFIFSLLLRNELESSFSRGAEEFDMAFPLFHHVHGFIQAFSGYGQSLISYNHYTNSIGIGFSLIGNRTPFI